jgi:UDP-N-acetylglucosamine 3-dehydrogenase
MVAQLKAAVIGGGSMGRNHARVFADMEDVCLVGVADLNDRALSHFRQTYNIRTYTDYRELLEREQPDLVSVVVPTEHHFAVARDVIRAGVPLLVEKPIAATIEEGLALARLAEERGVMLTVGHIERFNPAIRELKRSLDAGHLGQVYQIFARRIGPYPARIKDVGVVIDLATHDLDIMHYLTGSTVRRLHAEIGRRLHTEHEDLLSAMLRFDSDVIGVLDINWLTPTKVRELSVIGERGMFVANYLTQDLTFYENDSAQGEWPELAVMGVSEGRAIRYKVAKREPLREELAAFVRAVAAGEPAPVSATDGLLALTLAHKLVESGTAREQLILDKAHGFIWPPLPTSARVVGLGD